MTGLAETGNLLNLIFLPILYIDTKYNNQAGGFFLPQALAVQ